MKMFFGDVVAVNVLLIVLQLAELIHGHIEVSARSTSSESSGSRDDSIAERYTKYPENRVKNDRHARRRTMSENGKKNYRRKHVFDTYVESKETTTRMLPPLDPRYRRIYNPDETARIEDYPFIAALLFNNELWCGAVIVDRDLVLTAAHCLQLQYNNRFFREYVKMLTVRVGSANSTGGGEIYQVQEIFFHPNYKAPTLEYNIAAIKLHKNLSIENSKFKVGTIDYRREAVLPNDVEVEFLGWGSVLGGIGGFGGQVLLQKITLPIYDLSDCREIYGKDLVTRVNFCAGYISKAKNVCNHDAGGPALLGGQLVGILSFSSQRCDQADRPAVFTNVAATAKWLEGVREQRNPEFW